MQRYKFESNSPILKEFMITITNFWVIFMIAIIIFRAIFMIVVLILGGVGGEKVADRCVSRIFLLILQSACMITCMMINEIQYILL